jgi:hypothetical protein
MLTAARLFLGLRGLLKSIPWQVWAIAGLIGLTLLYGHHKQAQGYYTGVAEMQAQIDQAEAARVAAMVSEEMALRQLAKDADNAVYQNREANRDRTERFISGGGVRQACPGNRDTQDRSTGDNAGAGALPVVDDVPVVTVLPEDVRICTENTIKAQAWREWGLTLEANHEATE